MTNFIVFSSSLFVVSQVGHVRCHGGHAHRILDGAKHPAAGRDVRAAYRAAAVGLRHLLPIILTNQRRVVISSVEVPPSREVLVLFLLSNFPA